MNRPISPLPNSLNHMAPSGAATVRSFDDANGRRTATEIRGLRQRAAGDGAVDGITAVVGHPQ
jgi:hypothetical protein